MAAPASAQTAGRRRVAMILPRGEDGGRLDAVALAQLAEQRRAERAAVSSSWAMRSALTAKAGRGASEGGAPELQAASRAVSTRTLNHDSMLFTANCRIPHRPALPGTTAIAAKMGHQAQLEPRAEAPGAVFLPQPAKLQVEHQAGGPSAMTPLSPSSRVVRAKKGCWRWRWRSREQQDASDRRGDEDGGPHQRASRPAAKVQRHQSDLRLQSLAEGAHPQRLGQLGHVEAEAQRRRCSCGRCAQRRARRRSSCGCAAWCAGGTPRGCRSSGAGAAGEAVPPREGLVEAIGEALVTTSSSSQYQRGRRVRTR